jgi:hypothetical protein
MKKINNIFIEQYKKLDYVCKEKFGEDCGVSWYIDKLSEKQGRRKSDLSDTLGNLKALRHIRNKLAHEVDAFNKTLCKKEDVLWMRSFCRRIENGTDPLSSSKKRGKKQEKENTSPLRSLRLWEFVCFAVIILIIIIKLIIEK